MAARRHRRRPRRVVSGRHTRASGRRGLGTAGRARVLIAGAVILVGLSLTVAQTSANTVTAPGADLVTATLGADQLKPSNCSAFTVTAMVTGATTVNGTAANELILASTGIDSIDGKGGRDCILGGAGNDIINGGTGVDVCLGGPGTDTFTGCETQVQ